MSSRKKLAKTTIAQELRGYSELYTTFDRAILIINDDVKKEYYGEEVTHLAKGKYIDSTLEIKSHYISGRTILFFLDHDNKISTIGLGVKSK